MNRREIKVVFIADSHLVFKEKFLGIETHKSFEAVIGNILVHDQDADFYIFGGDLVQDQSKESFDFFKDISSKLSGTSLFTRGNHDINDFFFDEIKTNQKDYISFKSWCLVNLDSYSQGSIYGEITSEQIEFLQNISNKNIDTNIFLYMHHNLFPTNSPWLDQHITKNYQIVSKQFSDIENLKLVLSGHIHQEMEVVVDNTTFVSTPSTSFQFLPDKEIFTLDDKNPGYTVLNLYSDGSFEINYKRIDGFFGELPKRPELY